MITDLVMPDVTGDKLAVFMGTLRPHTAIVLMSSLAILILMGLWWVLGHLDTFWPEIF